MDNRVALVDPLSELLAQIRSLLDVPADAEPATRAVIDEALTDGYAYALTLEADRLRLERRLRETIRTGPDGGPFWAADLGELTRQLDNADQNLAHLRGLLAKLRAQSARPLEG
jgi:uncharacterized membrane protein YccC